LTAQYCFSSTGIIENLFWGSKPLGKTFLPWWEGRCRLTYCEQKAQVWGLAMMLVEPPERSSLGSSSYSLVNGQVRCHSSIFFSLLQSSHIYILGFVCLVFLVGADDVFLLLSALL
jgi:hypothetical protein